MEKKNSFIMKNEKKIICTKKMEFGYCPNCIAIQLLHCRQLGRLGRTGVGVGARRWARRALGAQGAGRRQAQGRWAQAGAGALGWACVGRWAGVRGALGRGARQGARQGTRQGTRQAGRASGRARERQEFERQARRAAGARALAGARERGRAAAGPRRGRQALGARQAGAGRARPGRLGWPWAVHSVHSAHFRSVLTRFFS